MDGEAPAQDFQHEPLDTSERELRLICILNIKDSFLRCKLEHVPFALTTERKYIALSYTWGPADKNETIVINDRAFRIRANLASYMHMVHKKLDYGFAPDVSLPSSGWMWIDQICIDQANNAERAQQIGLMANIFSKAYQVDVWLGQENADLVTPGMKLLAAMHERDGNIYDYLAEPERYAQVRVNGIVTPLVVTTEHLWRRAYFKEFQEPHQTGKNTAYVRLKPEIRTGMNLILTNAYWTRLWIVQEVLLAPRIVLRHGYNSVVWDSLKRFMDSKPGFKGVGARPQVINMSRDAWVPNTRRYDMLWMLQNFCQHECDDRRDKVFGILAVVKDDLGLRADYERSAEEVFILAALRLLRNMIGDEDAIIVTANNQLQRWFSILWKLREAMSFELGAMQTRGRNYLDVEAGKLRTRWLKEGDEIWKDDDIQLNGPSARRIRALFRLQTQSSEEN